MSKGKIYRLRARWRVMPGELQVGLAITIAFLIFIFLFFFINVNTDLDEPHSKYKAFLFSKPNEIGDTLAGFAGALAFLWLIVTTSMQAKELRLQRQELSLTRKEMAQQRKATQDMAKSMRIQAAEIEAERRERDYLDLVKEVDRKLEYARSRFLFYRGVEFRSVYSARGIHSSLGIALVAKTAVESSSLQDFFVNQCSHLKVSHQKIRRNLENGARIVEKEFDVSIFFEIISFLEDLVGFGELHGGRIKEKVDAFLISQILSEMKTFASILEIPSAKEGP